MIIRPWAEFTSDLPDDYLEDEEGEVINYGGSTVLAAIGEMLTRLGCEVGEPVDAGDHGAELMLTVGKRNLWAQVSPLEPYLFVLEQNALIKWGQPWPEYLDILKRLSVELSNDPRFHDVRWFTAEEVHTGIKGAPSPITD